MVKGTEEHQHFVATALKVPYLSKMTWTPSAMVSISNRLAHLSSVIRHEISLFDVLQRD